MGHKGEKRDGKGIRKEMREEESRREEERERLKGEKRQDKRKEFSKVSRLDEKQMEEGRK